MSEIHSLRPLAAVLVSAIGIVAIVASHRRPNVREAWTVLVAVSKFGIVTSMVPGVLGGTVYVTDLGALLPGVRFALRADPLGTLFALLASFLWIITSFYSIGYMRGLAEHGQTRYFAAFAASVSTAVGVAFASNLVVLYIFYELLTVATYPLVAHDETPEARRAGRKYLAYTFGGGVAVLAGTVLVFWLTGSVSFAAGGIEGLGAADATLARAAFTLLAAGFGVKAALMPLHSWLPDAMVAPTPVSGLLHAVAVVKSGVFGIARVVLDVFGPETVSELGMGLPLAAVAAFTILTASVIALRQDNLKRRLAYSTVSQLSYIVLGLGLLSPETLVGGLLHIPAHAFMKLTLFFCAGAIHVETHSDDISEMAGIGKRMPVTMSAFAVASLGMAGMPFVAGFVSKWYLLVGSIGAGEVIFAVVLLISGLLNVGYFWPIVYQAFFESEDVHDSKPLLEGPYGGRSSTAHPDGGTRERADAGAPEREEPSTAERSPGLKAERDGEYAVDRYPSDHTRPGEKADDGREDREDYKHDHVADHHGGPPPGGWERRALGRESTWFMIGPIATAVAGSIALGVAPYAFVFLALVERIVAGATGVVV